MTERRVPWQAKFVTLALVWGSSFLVMMVALRGWTAFQIVTVRIVLAAATLVGLLVVTRGRLPRGGRVWAHLLVCGFFLAALPFTCFVWSETRIASALAGISNATTPIATVLAVMLMLPSERVTPRKIAAVAAGFAGVVLIAQPWDLAARPDPAGLAAAIVGGLSYGVGWTYNRRFLAGSDLGGLSQPTALMLCGSVLIVPVGLVAWWLNRAHQPRPWSPLVGADGHTLLIATSCMALLAVLHTGVAYMLQYDVVRDAGPMVSSTMTYLIPAVSVVLGVLVLGERLGWPQLLGFGVVLAAALAVNTAPRRVPLPTPDAAAARHTAER